MFRRWTLGLLLAAMPGMALAQTLQCRVPDKLPSYEREDPAAGEINNDRPTHYLLALSWSPQFCKTRKGDARHAFQCDGQAGKFGFILHGLWPDLPGKADPAWCRPAKLLQPALVKQHMCMTPSAQLLQHEWAKHGTCATDQPERYFRAASLLYAALNWPDMGRLSRGRTTGATLTAAFAAANPGLRPDMIAVLAERGGWLKEVRICLNADMRPQPCRPEDRGMQQSRFIRIWRGD